MKARSVLALLLGSSMIPSASTSRRSNAEPPSSSCRAIKRGASSTTVALVSLVVGTGRARELPTIIRQLVAMSAAEANKEVAEVRSAIDLNDDQRKRLAQALGQATGKQVEVKVVVDPSVLGGIVAQVGDTVIDGSVRGRLDQLKNAF